MIARANAKAALADARSTLTSYLSENLSIIDGEIAASIVIFVYKAKAYYVFGYSNTGPDMGKLMQSEATRIIMTIWQHLLKTTTVQMIVL